MTAETLIASIAVLVSLGAAYFSWATATKSNHLNKINSLIALRQHYFAMFQLEADFIERHRGMPSAVKSAGESAATIADRLRVIDTKLAGHYEQLIRGARA